MNISVFGGSQPKEGDTAYTDALKLGRLLAQRGHTVLTGGYIGTMEAVSRGANEAGGHVVGATCDDIEAWRPVSPNRWVKEERRRKTLIERLQVLIEGCEAALALPGGAGTLTEIALMWNLMIVESLPRRPLILIGSGWQSTFDQFFKELDVYTTAKQRELVGFADDIKKAIDMLEG
ncbi:MAG: LOG family protein [Anaerolineales bacterium]|nr:LOG family protein [Anaerolineales bacterium]